MPVGAVLWTRCPRCGRWPGGGFRDRRRSGARRTRGIQCLLLPRRGDPFVILFFQGHACYLSGPSARNPLLCINRKALLFKKQGLLFPGSPGRTRTANLVVNSHPLCRLSYRGSFFLALPAPNTFLLPLQYLA